MKKLILLTFGILMTSNIALACGGIIVKGTSGTNYCLSKQKMNWYSAAGWCQVQNMKLIDIKEVCGDINNTCSELVLSDTEKNNITASGGTLGWLWTHTSSTAYVPFLVTTAGKINPSTYALNGYRQHEAYAFCK